MKLGYIFSVAIIPFLVLGSVSFDQGQGQKKNGNGNGSKEKGRNEQSSKNKNERDHNDDQDDDKNENRGKQFSKNMDKGKYNPQGRKDEKRDNTQWRVEERWNEGKWDDNRFDARMKKLKGYKKSNWVNSTYYPGVIWFTGNNDYYNNKGPKGNKKVSICHQTGGNYPVMINVSENAVKAHLNHGDYIGECRDFDRSRYSDNYWNTRNNYYNQYTSTTETLSFGEQILAIAIEKLTGARSNLVPLRSTLQEDELRRKEAAIINLQNDVYNLQNSLARSNEQVGLQVNLKF